MLKEIKQRKCRKCKYNLRKIWLNCCNRPDKYGLRSLKPLKLICFKFKKVEGER